SVALEIGSSLLCVRVLPDDPAAERQARLSAIAQARALVQKLSQRGGASARVHVNVCLHASDATLRGADVTSETLHDLNRWAPDQELVGVACSAAILAGLDLEHEGQELRSARGFWRVL